MITFRDRTFCQASIDNRCSNMNCYRFLTEQSEKDFDKWSCDSGGMIAISDFFDNCKERIINEL